MLCGDLNQGQINRWSPLRGEFFFCILQIVVGIEYIHLLKNNKFTNLSFINLSKNPSKSSFVIHTDVRMRPMYKQIRNRGYDVMVHTKPANGVKNTQVRRGVNR